MIVEARVAAYAWIERDTQVLLTLWVGAPEAGIDPRWTLPGGGVEWGEQPDQALVREVFEETGYHVTPAGPIDIQVVDIPPGQLLSGDAPLRVVRSVHRATISGGHLTNEVGGTTLRAAWFPLAELGRLPAGNVLDWALGLGLAAATG